MDTPDDHWAEGEAYDRFMGRWSRALAGAFVRWLETAPGLRWLDVGCGTGSSSAAILHEADPAYVLGVDPSPGFIRRAEAGNRDPRLAFQVAGVENLPADRRGFDRVVSGLAFNFFPDPAAALRAMKARTVSGGVVAATVWDYAGEMQFLRIFWDTAISFDPGAGPLDEGARFPLCRPDRLERLFQEAGLTAVRVDPLTIATPFAGFTDYWEPFLAGTGPAPSYVASLDADRRRQLEVELRARLAPGDDGKIPLTARAWAVRGTAR